MYKQDIKVMDCTVRDGGLMNKWQFSDDFVKGVYNACVEAGIDYMEIGYLSSGRRLLVLSGCGLLSILARELLWLMSENPG